MTTLSTPCTICSTKGIGIFKCQGCSNVFCRKHVSEHRDNLRYQLDEIIHEHDQIYQLINQSTNAYDPLMNEIDQWEENSIKKIQQVAQNIRDDILQHIRSQKETATETLKHLSQRLRKACEEDDYVENDLRSWTMKLEDLKKNFTPTHSSITLYEDPKLPLIANINISSVKQQTLPKENFLHSTGDIHIEDNGQLAIHDNRQRSDAFLSGRNEYTQDKHKIRFIINKKDSNYITTFGITSMQSKLSVYGWSSDDQTVGDQYSQLRNLYNQSDMKGETTLQIEFTIDCDQRKISYLNERTGCTKEMNVDLDSCPFPWQLYFYLYDTGDRVRLLTLNRT